MCHCPPDEVAAAVAGGGGGGVSGGAALRALLDRAADLLLSPGEPDAPVPPDIDLLAWLDGDTAAEDGGRGSCGSSSSDSVPDAKRPGVGGEGKRIPSPAHGRPTSPTSKRARTTAANSQYERRRRERINQRIRALGRLLPNFRESDRKESLLDKAIDHIRELQAEGRMMCAINSAGRRPNGPPAAVFPAHMLLPVFAYPTAAASATPCPVGFYQQQQMFPSGFGFYPEVVGMTTTRAWPTRSASL